MRAVPLILLPMLAGLAAAGPAAATVTANVVAINSPTNAITQISTLTLGAKYRISNGNFDQSLDSGGGTQNVAGGPNFISADLGNQAALNNRTYSFTLRNIAGQGIVFSLTRAPNITSTLAWGSFNPALSPAPTVSAAQLRAAPDTPPYVATNQPSGTLLSPGQLPMNALHLEVSSRLRPLASGNSYSPVVTLSDLAFTTSGAILKGALTPSMIVTPATSLTNATMAEPGTGFASQWLLTTGNFWDFDWAITGTVNAQINNIVGSTGQLDEYLKFGISGKQVSFTGAIPEPASWVMLIAGFGLVGAAMRRDRAGPGGPLPHALTCSRP